MFIPDVPGVDSGEWGCSGAVVPILFIPAPPNFKTNCLGMAAAFLFMQSTDFITYYNAPDSC